MKHLCRQQNDLNAKYAWMWHRICHLIKIALVLITMNIVCPNAYGVCVCVYWQQTAQRSVLVSLKRERWREMIRRKTEKERWREKKRVSEPPCIKSLQFLRMVCDTEGNFQCTWFVNFAAILPYCIYLLSRFSPFHSIFLCNGVCCTSTCFFVVFNSPSISLSSLSLSNVILSFVKLSIINWVECVTFFLVLFSIFFSFLLNLI